MNDFEKNLLIEGMRLKAVEHLTEAQQNNFPQDLISTIERFIISINKGKNNYLQDPTTGRMMGSVSSGGGAGGKGSGSDNESTANSAAGKVEQKGTVDYNDKQAVMQKLSEAEKEFVDLPYEKCRVITADGRVWDVTGTSATVDTSVISEKYGVSLEGSSSYHNHPANETYFSFSGEDAGDFIANSEAVSIASDYKYRYIMGRTNETLVGEYERVRSDFKYIHDTEIYRMSFNGNIDIDEDGNHETMTRLANKYHFKYRRVLKNGE